MGNSDTVISDNHIYNDYKISDINATVSAARMIQFWPV